MANKKNLRKAMTVPSYNKLIENNDILSALLEELKKEFKFPYNGVLEVGTGTGIFLTKYLTSKEREKQIEKFYGMEPIDEFFEESKRHVVRLSHTDATEHEYYGGNPFDAIVQSLVTNHIKPDKKEKYIHNINSNLTVGGKFLVMDMFIPKYNDEEGRKKSIEEFIKANIEYFKAQKNDFVMNYFYEVLNGRSDDYLAGDYKISVEVFKENLEKQGFKKVEIKLFKGADGFDWEKLGYYIVSAEK